MSMRSSMEPPGCLSDNVVTFEQKISNANKKLSSNSALDELNDIVTPIKVDRLNYWLQGYDEREEVVNDFTFGFDIGCIQEPDFLDEEHNHSMALEHEDEVDKFLLNYKNLVRFQSR